VVRIKSARGFSLGRISRFISEECNPLLIASDVRPASRLLEKAAASFPVRLCTPRESLTARVKARLVRESGHRLRERHKADALAAALFAYRGLRPLLGRIERKLSARGLGKTKRGRVARMIISGECSNIEKALSSLEKRKSKTWSRKTR
jgi:predicted RNase H-like nuclease (RuvC/YqgF family)